MLKQLGFVILLLVMAVAAAPAQAQITGANWSAAFFNNTTLSGSPVANEVYPDGIYFNWASGQPLKADNMIPVPGVTPDNFSVRFTSTQTFAQAGTYVFTVYVDDGMRVYFNDVPVIDQFNQNTTPDFRTFTFERVIAASEQIAMRVEYVEFTGSALFAFQWGRRTAPPIIYIDSPYDGEKVVGDYAPTFTWQAVDTPAYVFTLWSDGGTVLLRDVYPAAALCAGESCSLDTGALPNRAGIMLESDEYAWQVKSQGAAEKMKSPVIEFLIEYPGKPVNLTPDANAIVTTASPTLTWDSVTAANQYKVMITRVKNGAKINLGWQTADALDCDAVRCTLDLSALDRPVVLQRGKYTWRVFARDTALASNVGKSKSATFTVKPQARTAPLPAPQSPEGFRAP